MNKLQKAIQAMLGQTTVDSNERSLTYNKHQVGRYEILIPEGMRLTAQRKDLFKAMASGLNYSFKRSVLQFVVVPNEDNDIKECVIRFEKPEIEEAIASTDEEESPATDAPDKRQKIMYVCKQCNIKFVSLISCEKHCKLYKHNRGIRSVYI